VLEQILTMHELGVRGAEIARLLGVSESIVSRTVKKGRTP
jgi:predicted transcriptional regulator